MGKGKTDYGKRKHLLPEWNENRQKCLVFNNKMKIYKTIHQKATAQQYSYNWYKYRKVSIPSSLIRKAVGGSESFLRHYEIMEMYSAGIAVEAVLLALFKDKISSGLQTFSSLFPYISASPDRFIKGEGIPVEIKTKEKGSLEDIVRLHYHQIQFTMFCGEKDRLLLIAYIYNQMFDIVEIQRDQPFIDYCLPS